MELKRILFSKKTWFTFMLFLVLMVYFFVKDQTSELIESKEMNQFRNEELSKCEALDSSQAVEYLNEQKAYYSAMYTIVLSPLSLKHKEYEKYSDSYNQLKDQLNPDELKQKQTVIEELLIPIQYIATYHDNITNIKEKASQMAEMSLFAKKDSFAYREIQKSVKDYAPLEQITVTLGNDKPITSVFHFQLIHYLLLALVIVIISQFLDERKLGLWSMVHSQKNGRFTLAIKRAGILFTGVSLFTISVYSILFGIACKIHGVPSFSRMIQSIPEFENFIIPVTIGKFILIYIATRIMTLYLIALMIWFVMSILKSRNVAILTLGLIFAIEYGCYRFIGPQSILNLFKYINIFYFINPDDIFTYYRNLRVIKYLVGRLELIYISLIILPIVFLALCVAVNALKHPVKSPGKLEKLIDKIVIAIQRPFELIPAWMVEFHKTFVWQKGLIILGIFVYMAISGIKDIGFTYRQSQYPIKIFCETYAGELSQSALDYVSTNQAKCDKAAEDYNQGIQKLKSGMIEQKELDKLEGVNESYSEMRELLLAINKKIDYIKSQTEKGYEVHLIDDTSYNNLFGVRSYLSDDLISIKIIFLLVLLVSGIFAFEKKSNTVTFLRTLKKGRQTLFAMKLIITVALTIGLWAMYYGIQLYEFGSNYGFTYLSSPLRSIKAMENAPINCSIGTFLIALYLTRLIMLLCIAFIIMMISTLMNLEQSLITSLVICLMPSVMIYVGIDFFKMLSVTMPVSFIENFVNMNGYGFVIPILIVLGLGLTGLLVSYKKWCSYVQVDLISRLRRGGN